MLNTSQLNDASTSDQHAEKILGAMIRLLEDRKLKSRLTRKLAEDHNIHRSIRHSAPGGKIRKMFFSLAAIAAAALLFFSSPAFDVPSSEHLLASQLAAIELEGSRSASTSDEIDQIRANMLAEFQRGNFAEAVVHAKKVVSLPAATDEDRFNCGLLLLKNESYAEASHTLSQLKKTAALYTVESDYYGGLALLAIGNDSDARLLFENISSTDGGRFYPLAQQFLED